MKKYAVILPLLFGVIMLVTQIIEKQYLLAVVFGVLPICAGLIRIIYNRHK